ncbi:arylacetamide deacetylase-like [Ostrea edulis]|uniref:arylacetamide deacetylase-like n=1 Tax=Ostrea edulis TaxID=37623 RepID=UPI0024AEE2CB|nr:arylacetamide deacetylase-like [Ostrea edulis]XP_056004777.1 arylacetamide deacetylase-like [Ostrea edulis]
MRAAILGSGMLVGACLAGAGYALLGLLFTVAVAVGTLLQYLYVPMPAIAEEKFKRQRFLAGLKIIYAWIGFLQWMGRGHEMKIGREIFFLEATDTETNKEVVTEDTKFQGVTVRVYRPVDLSDTERLPGVVYFHGGGWCYDAFGKYDIMIKRMLKFKRMIVIYVRYRLAPEFPFPTGIDDCFAATRYVQRNTESLNLDSEKLILMGDSAGGCMTMNMLIRMITEAEHGLPKFKIQVAIYPFVQALNFATPSYQLFVDDNAPTLQYSSMTMKFLITYALGNVKLNESEIRKLLENAHWTDEIRNSKLPNLVSSDVLPPNIERPKVWKQLSKNTDSALAQKFNGIFLDVRYSPLFADDSILQKMPKTYILSAGLDSIRDDAFFLEDRLRKLNVDVTHRHWASMDHPFLCFDFYDNSLKALEEIVDYLDKSL